MFSRISKQFNYTNIALTVALVFAMGGGAYAAGKYLITSTKQISPKVLKSLIGKPGARGPAGVAGPAGPAGAKGETGASGAAGKEGVAGKGGINGESVSAKEVKTTEAACAKQGGSSFAVGGATTLACNGKEGSAWTDKGTLPKAASERGQWAISGHTPVFVLTGLPFTIPLAAPLAGERVHIIGLGEGLKEEKEAAAIADGECTGTSKEPGAKSGNLCVFVSASFGGCEKLIVENAEGEAGGAGVSGAILSEGSLAEGSVACYGDWVVTG